ncbi:glycosyltransferase [Stappia taiwanensis]|uniref:Glycosyltransferase n=1 Tax=Stappia taiwanensis TaxID=992267 RepID=A0A838XQH2_9HYPH|nr:glycosyltransferase [Stappia taiwanensis]MBA4610958.1 glycosyltransferase [Stappia taiwanensis]GGE94474.1 glycosyl transferase [Stappia taiwanensis]
MSFSAFIHVQHLLGTGHVVRAAAIGRALAARGVRVTLATGNTPPPTLDLAGLRVIALPPVRTADARFNRFLTPEGGEIDDAWKAARRDATLAAFSAGDAGRPFDLLLTETWPFGRRAFAFEMGPLLEAARARPRPPLIGASIRDILVRKQELWKEEWMADQALAFYDRVLVHSDPDFIRLEDSFPFADRISELVRYTGFVEAAPRPAPAPLPRSLLTDPEDADGTDEVIVSCGGGAVGEALLDAALDARALSRRAGDCRWRLLAGHGIAEDRFAELTARAGHGVIVERARSDFPALLGRARLSVSQAGYNTVLDILHAGVPAVFVPFAQIRETEQQQRAEALARHGRAVVTSETGLTAERLAAAADDALSLPRRPVKVRFGGAAASADLLLADLEAMTPR